MLISYVPNGNGFLYYADKGGDENDHMYWVDSDDSTLNLTPFDGAKSNFYGWSRTKKVFYFISNRRNPKFFDLYEKEINNFQDAKAFKLDLSK